MEDKTMNIKPIMELATDAIGGEIGGLPMKTICFYPAERVQEIFNRLKAARGTDKEAAELRIFAGRMIWLYENQTEESVTFPGYEATFHMVAYGEAALNTKLIENIGV